MCEDKPKTLIGKEDYLFLQNDSNRELDVHCNNLLMVDSDFSIIMENYLLIVFPDKSLIYNKFLPDGYNAIYRPGYEFYANILKDNILDLFPVLKDKDTYFKNDTHMNLYGAYLSYQCVIDKLNDLFDMNLNKFEYDLIKIEDPTYQYDLLQEYNLKGQHINDKSEKHLYHCGCDNFYFNNYKIQRDNIYNLSLLSYDLIDTTDQYIDTVVDWELLISNIIHTNYSEVKNDYKVVIFYDSFLISSFLLWVRTFKEIYFIRNSHCKYLFDVKSNRELIEKINPDYIFDFRVERMLM